MQELTQTLGGLIIILGAIAIVYIIARFNYLTKKAMLEKGLSPTPSLNKNRLIDIGCMLFFLGIGVMTTSFYNTASLNEDQTDLLTWGTILVIGSFGPISAYFIRQRIER